MGSEDFKRGQAAGKRWAVTWLHDRAKEMNDPHARQVLNSAGFNMGVAAKKAEIVDDTPTPAQGD